jgi:hypothetical protein
VTLDPFLARQRRPEVVVALAQQLARPVEHLRQEALVRGAAAALRGQRRGTLAPVGAAQPLDLADTEPEKVGCPALRQRLTADALNDFEA